VEIDQLVAAARDRTRLDDFGADTWREGFEVLVRSVNDESRLNSLGESVVADQLVGHLANRLQVEDWYRRHPEIDDQVITAPLFGLGLPRTGSTALSFLLALDPGRRSLRTWEASRPCPPPEAATSDTDPRIAETQAGLDITSGMFPDFVGMLPTSATGPQECLLVLAFEFRSMVFEGMSWVPSYTEWLFSCDMEPAYRYHRRVLKLLQWRCPPTSWWLKTPSHMHAIGGLDRVYPDARFVMTHRDIASVIPSVAALMTTLSGMLTDSPDPSALARHCCDLWEEALHRTIAFRDAGNQSRFHDIAFADMQADPIGTIDGVYRWLGEDLGPVARERMTGWWAANSAERHGAHRHDASTFGLDPAELRERFRFYNDRFGLT
jgi:hypothetical protein